MITRRLIGTALKLEPPKPHERGPRRLKQLLQALHSSSTWRAASAPACPRPRVRGRGRDWRGAAQRGVRPRPRVRGRGRDWGGAAQRGVRPGREQGRGSDNLCGQGRADKGLEVGLETTAGAEQAAELAVGTRSADSQRQRRGAAARAAQRGLGAAWSWGGAAGLDGQIETPVLRGF